LLEDEVPKGSGAKSAVLSAGSKCIEDAFDHDVERFVFP